MATDQLGLSSENLYTDGWDSLMEIEHDIQSRLRRIADKIGGQYIPPSNQELEEKFEKTLSASPYIFSQKDADGRIWAPGGKVGKPPKNVEVYNRSGAFGFIIKAQESKDPKQESVIRVYRGCTFNPDEKQVASLARIPGIQAEDLYKYLNGQQTAEDLINKIEDPHTRELMLYDLQSMRKRAKKLGMTELEEVIRGHTDYTSGAVAFDPFVSMVLDPANVYFHSNLGNVYGDFLGKRTINCVLVIDVPGRETISFGNEVGIKAEIKPEWIRAIVPSSGEKETLVATVRRAETYL